MSKRHSIQISDQVYQKLKQMGQFGESFDKLIARILYEEEESKK